MNWEERLVASGEISVDQLADAICLSRQRSIPTQDALLLLQYVDPWPITLVHSQQYGYPAYNFYDETIPQQVICSIPEIVSRDLRAMPVLISDNTLWYTTPFFDNRPHQNRIQEILNRPMSPMWAPDSWIWTADRKYYIEPYYTQFMSLWHFSRYSEDEWILVEGNKYEEYCRTRMQK